MNLIDIIMVSQSESIRYDEYSSMPIDRIDMYRNLVQLRMVYKDKGFRSHLDILNKAVFDKYFFDATFSERREMLSIWNMIGLNGILAVSELFKDGYNCKIINNFDAEFDLLIELCKNMSNVLIGISTTFILQWSEIARIVKKIHNVLPGATFVLGGAFVSSAFLIKGASHFEKPMRKYGIKYIIHSYNSEKDLSALVKTIKEEKNDFESVNNLIYIDDKKNYRITSASWNEPKISPSYNMWPKLSEIVPSASHARTLQIRTASGCPFHCSFCSYPVTAKGCHYAEVEEIRSQLEAVRQNVNIEAIVFIDDTINVPTKRFYQIVDLLKEFKFRWYAFFRAQYAEESLVRAMKESGCDGLYLGLESANDNILKRMNKKARVDDFKRGIALLKKYDITVFAAFIIGFPGETEETIDDNIKFIEETGIDFYSVKEFFYLHNAPVFSKREEFMLVGEGNTWKHATMTSVQASEMKLRMFEKITKSIHIDPDLGLWYMVYLRDRNFSWSQIREFQKILNSMIKKDNDGIYDDKEALFNKLITVLV